MKHEKEEGTFMDSGRTARLVVIGQGYVGLPLAVRAAEVGFSVVGLEVDPEAVASLNSGRSHIEDISDSKVAMALNNGYRATVDPACLTDADVVVVCVPTPLKPGGDPDLTYVETAARTINRYLNQGCLYILESTSYQGTTEEIFLPAVMEGHSARVGQDVYVGFSPERIDPGNKEYHLQNTPKVVSGVTSECLGRTRDFYRQLVDEVVEAVGTREAELAKVLENTFRHVNIALMNEMVRYCHELKIDIWDAISCASTKPFGYMPFTPGPGVGGHCIPVDPAFLGYRIQSKLGVSFRMIATAQEINDHAPIYVAERCTAMLIESGVPIAGSKILLLGVAYKANTADCRETPAMPIARRLTSLGATISYFDPLVDKWSWGGKDLLSSVEKKDLAGACASADLVVLLQGHADIPWGEVTSHAKALLDTKAFLPPGGPVTRL